MKDISFADPFIDEVSKYPIRFAAPVFFGESPYASFAASLNNGTATLLRLRDRFLGVTCKHVLDRYRQLKEIQPTVFQLGHVPIEPEKHVVCEDHRRDLAIVDLTTFLCKTNDLTEANFVQPLSWPPDEVAENDVLCLGGFPGIWREQRNLGHLRFYSFSCGTAEVSSVGGEWIMTMIRAQDCIADIADGKVLGSLGGLSGGPVFVWRTAPLLRAELVGFICEYQDNLDLLRVCPARVIREDGTIE